MPVRGLKMAKNVPKIADIGIFCLDDLHIFWNCLIAMSLSKTSMSQDS